MSSNDFDQMLLLNTRIKAIKNSEFFIDSDDIDEDEFEQFIKENETSLDAPYCRALSQFSEKDPKWKKLTHFIYNYDDNVFAWMSYTFYNITKTNTSQTYTFKFGTTAIYFTPTKHGFYILSERDRNALQYDQFKLPEPHPTNPNFCPTLPALHKRRNEILKIKDSVTLHYLEQNQISLTQLLAKQIASSIDKGNQQTSKAKAQETPKEHIKAKDALSSNGRGNGNSSAARSNPDWQTQYMNVLLNQKEMDPELKSQIENAIYKADKTAADILFECCNINLSSPTQKIESPTTPTKGLVENLDIFMPSITREEVNNFVKANEGSALAPLNVLNELQTQNPNNPEDLSTKTELIYKIENKENYFCFTFFYYSIHIVGRGINISYSKSFQADHTLFLVTNDRIHIPERGNLISFDSFEAFRNHVMNNFRKSSKITVTLSELVNAKQSANEYAANFVANLIKSKIKQGAESSNQRSISPFTILDDDLDENFYTTLSAYDPSTHAKDQPPLKKSLVGYEDYVNAAFQKGISDEAYTNLADAIENGEQVLANSILESLGISVINLPDSTNTSDPSNSDTFTSDISSSDTSHKQKESQKPVESKNLEKSTNSTPPGGIALAPSAATNITPESTKERALSDLEEQNALHQKDLDRITSEMNDIKLSIREIMEKQKKCMMEIQTLNKQTEQAEQSLKELNRNDKPKSSSDEMSLEDIFKQEMENEKKSQNDFSSESSLNSIIKFNASALRDKKKEYTFLDEQLQKNLKANGRLQNDQAKLIAEISANKEKILNLGSNGQSTRTVTPQFVKFVEERHEDHTTLAVKDYSAASNVSSSSSSV